MVVESGRCSACSEPIEGEPAGTGYLLFLWGDDYDEERPPLCQSCVVALGMTAMNRLYWEEEDG